MATADLMGWTMLVELLWETTLAGSAAMLLVLALRRHLRHAFGSVVAYAAWAAVPAAMIAVSLPAATVTVVAAPEVVSFPATAPLSTMAATALFNGSTWLVVAWLFGAGVMALRQRGQQRAFRTGLGRLTLRADGLQQAESLAGLPAALGLVRPAIVVPADFDSRYSAEERALMQAHERSHIASGDLQVNALVAGVRSVFWFNPLLHLAARHFRHDQELACDQRVMARHPQGRRAYGEAMFKTQLASQPSPVGCHWAVFDPVRRHPLTERIAMLKQPVPTAARWIGGGALVLSLTFGAALIAWSAQPKREVAVATSLRPAVSEPVDGSGQDAAAAAVVPQAQGRHAGSGALPPAPPAVPALPEPPAPNAPRLAVAPPPPPPPPVAGSAAPAPLPPPPVQHQVPTAPAAPPRAPHLKVAAPPSPPPPPPRPVTARTPAPKYPAGALAQQTRGKVVLEIDIDVTGKPTHVQVVKSEPAGVFDQASVDAARQWRFKPEIENGKAVPGRVRVPVEFAARKPAPAPGL